MHYEPGCLYDWQEVVGTDRRPVLVEEARALRRVGKRYDEGVQEVLAFVTRVAEGERQPIPGSCRTVEDVNEEICAFGRKGVILLYTAGTPCAQDGKRAVFLLMCAKARSAHPAVADTKEAERRLRAWRRRDGHDGAARAEREPGR